MRRSPRRPLILKRRKLPFQLNDPPANVVPSKEPHGGTTTPTTTPIPDNSSPKPIAVNPCFPDGIHVVAHPTMPDTQVVVIPQTADLQCVIGALTAKGKEHGPQGPNKFILLSGSGGLENESGFLPSSEGDAPPPPRSTGRPPGKVKEEPSSLDIKPLTGLNQFNKDLDCSPLDDSLTNIQWLGRMSTDTVKGEVVKENYSPSQQEPQADGVRMEAEGTRDTKSSLSDRPPYSYMAMIQFAINSKASRRMTLKEIYTWIEDHFPFFQQQTKPGWKNSIRHNLSLHDMFTRETSPDGKVSYWTIRPEANRCLTLDQVYKQPGSEATITLVPVPRPLVPHQEQTGMFASSLGRGSRGSVRRMKPLLPRSESYLVPIQLPASTAGASIYLPSPAVCSPQVQLRPAPQRTRVTPRAKKRVRIAPKVAHIDGPAVLVHPITPEVKEEAVSRALTPRRDPRRGGAAGGGGGGSSRRKQRLVLPSHEEPVLFPDSTFFDSGVASDASSFQDPQQGSPTSRELSFKTPVKGGSGGGGSNSNSHLASSTPSKPPGLEPWKVTPRGKSTQQAMLDFSPIRTPSGPLHTPQQLHHHLHDYSSFSFSGTPFRELPLFSSPRELLSSSCGRSAVAGDSPPAGRSLEGLMLDTLNDSLSKVLVDISFSALEDEDMGAANISWSEFIPQMM